jgi:cell division protein FtsB
MGKKGIAAGLVLSAMLLSAIFLPGHSRLRELRSEREQYKRRISLLEEYNKALQEEIERMREDPEYIEKKARDKLGIVRKGEVVYRRHEQ